MIQCHNFLQNIFIVFDNISHTIVELLNPVQKYLEQHLHKTWTAHPVAGISQIYSRQRKKSSKFAGSAGGQRRSLSFKGSIKRTRSITVEASPPRQSRFTQTSKYRNRFFSSFTKNNLIFYQANRRPNP